ncbi:tetratricopeptide repeat protein [Tenacibaculum xiamenense]|uniref:tetratricopeptide repeat protein n=1 Tax=Tenacibaculum xiamenense TaxID=1261553 RepID=UPI003895F5CB
MMYALILKGHLKRWGFVLSVCACCFAFQLKEKKADHGDTNKKIVKSFYDFIESEDKGLLDSLLLHIRRNELKFEEDTINSKILYLKAVNNLNLLRYADAENFYSKSFELAKKTNDYLLMGLVYNDRGVIASKSRRNFLKAEEHYKQAVEYFKSGGLLVSQLGTYYNLTIVGKKQGDCEKSLNYARACLELIDKIPNSRNLLKLLYIIKADCNVKLGNYQEAQKDFMLADSVISEEDPQRSLFYLKYAKYHELRNDYSKANELYKNVITLRNKEKRVTETSLKEAFERELGLENKLKKDKEVVIKSQRRVLYLGGLIIVVLIVSLFLVYYLAKKNKERSKEIFKLNSNLKNLVVDLKEKNIALEDNREEIEHLLNLNEQTLFSRMLKISTYNDSIEKLSEEIDCYIDNNNDVPIYLMSLRNKLQALISEEELWEDFKVQFEKIRPNFFDKLKKVAPNLSVNDLKHCTYIVSNLKSKEVAQLINVSPRSVETTRYRIKKKIGLEKEDSLFELLNEL